MRILSNHFIIAAALAGMAMTGPSPANAACAISIGTGEGPTQAKAVRLARRDARQKAGNIRPDNASYSEPACYVADDFQKGIATYGCEVEYSFCSNPRPPRQAAPKPEGEPKHRKVRQILKTDDWRKHARHQFGGSHRHGSFKKRGWGQGAAWSKGHARTHGKLEFGGWRKTRTEVSCLRFNAKASGRNADEASGLANGALIRSMSANIGGGFRHSNMETSGPACSQTGSRKVACVQTARYCF